MTPTYTKTEWPQYEIESLKPETSLIIDIC